VLCPVLILADAGQIADVVVRSVSVNVVNVLACRNRPVVMDPNVSVQAVASPRKVPPMRRVVALRIAVVLVPIEDHRLDLNASWLEPHNASLFRYTLWTP
jgi:hypothetical protein